MNQSPYAIEGGVLPLESPTYVEREADEELFQAIVAAQPASRVCAVLAARQLGKTSLMVRTAKRLMDEEKTVAQINLQNLGGVESDDILWFNLLKIICACFPAEKYNTLENHLDNFWDRESTRLPTLRVQKFLLEAILPQVDCELVIFFDEIQTLVNWGLQNEFIGFLRSLLEAQNQPLFNKLTIVLIGVAKPSDLITHRNYAWNLGEQIELKRLAGDCEPLQVGLKDVSSDTKNLLQLILGWTGGQPFLTQVVCDLVRRGKIRADLDIEAHVAKIVSENIVKDWRKQDRQNHLQEVENWFSGQSSQEKAQKRLALRDYEVILEHGTLEFTQAKHQWDLLLSGLVIKEDGQLRIANRIYEQIFNAAWVINRRNRLIENTKISDLSKVYNREVFVLIDQSGSMSKTDGGHSTRWQRLGEQLLGDVSTILDYTDDKGNRVCEEIMLVPYSINRFRGSLYRVSNVGQVESFFEENRPVGNANIAPTLEKCFEIWLDGREKITAQEVEDKKAQGAMFIIYIDGQFDDSPAFEETLKKICQKVDSHQIFKVIIIGFGKDINTKYFDELDVNKRKGKLIFEDAHGEDCNVVVFELAEEIDPSVGIVEVMQRQLRDNNNLRVGHGT